MICVSCEQEFELPRTRGRPPKRCETCRRENNPTRTEEIIATTDINGIDRVSNLEIMLKSRGTHISQNRGQYE